MPLRSPADIDFAQLPLKNLSEYGFFKGELNKLIANDKVLSYEPISPLFTDYAHKSRFVWMPEGTSASILDDPTQTFDFPQKAILIKNFYYPADFAKPEAQRRIIETRLLVNQEDGWKAYPYVWNDEQTDAKYKVTGGITDVHWQDENGEAKDIKYAMPNKNQCKSCHNQNDKFQPIGPKVKQLDNELTYENGEKINQLIKWQQVGYLTPNTKSEEFIKLVNIGNQTASLDLKARSYLEANCAHCHNKSGPASTSGLYLNIEEQDPFHWGVLKSPVAAGIGAGKHKFAIAPGKSDESIIPYRMNSTNPGVMMPEIGRVSIHSEGVALVKAWINEME
ncbi:MAG: putative repeat protein (TIGR03806 family) [Spirosomataceae bacterium]|jgi:uncharacterized repeat protein (TIGR03806 family)